MNRIIIAAAVLLALAEPAIAQNAIHDIGGNISDETI